MSTTHDPGPVDPATHGDDTGYTTIQATPEFAQLRARFRRFVFPMTALFLVWYFLYVLLSTYASGFMAKQVVGNVNIGLLFGVLQFVSTFAITMAYARWADRSFDTAAAELGERVLAHGRPDEGSVR
ncbi:DUF485 domain-containing protein [Angustibacter aerolatus]